MTLGWLQAAPPAEASGEAMPWRTDLASAQAEAEQSGKLVLIHFWTESCGPCRLLERRVFSAPGVAQAVARDYVPVKINAQQQPSVAQAYSVTRVPTDVVIAPDGQLVQSFVSPPTPVAYLALVNKLAASRGVDRGRYAAAASSAPFAATPAGQQLPGDGQVLNPTYGGLAASTPVRPPASPAARPSAPAVVENPSFTAGTTTAPPLVAANDTPVVAPAASAVAQQTAEATAPAESPRLAELAKRLPPGSPPIGFDGFCAVTLRKEWAWVEGDPKWGAIHLDRTYLFTSEAARDAFLKSPDLYSPALSGNDPVLAVESKRAVPGMRQHGVEYDGRYYLFASRQTFEKFWSNPGAYAAGAQKTSVAAGPAGSVTR